MLKSNIQRFGQKFGYNVIKNSRLRSIKKFKKNSDDTGFDYYEVPNGNYYLPKNCEGDSVANTIKDGKLVDSEILDLAKSYVKPNSIILDIGAKYGQMAIEFSKLSNSTTIFAFEDQKMAYDSLEKNIFANHSNNVMSFYNAVYDMNNDDSIFPEVDQLEFPSNSSYDADLNTKTGRLAKSITIDSLRFDSPISFMKIDCVRTGLAAMKGAFNTISKHQMPIIFKYEEQLQNDFNTSFQYYIDFVDSINYKFLKTIDEINYLIVPR